MKCQNSHPQVSCLHQSCHLPCLVPPTRHLVNMADEVLTAALTGVVLTVAVRMAVATSTAAEADTAPMVAVDSTEAVLTAVAISTPAAVDIVPAVVVVSEAAGTSAAEILVAGCQVDMRRKVLARAFLHPTSLIRRDFLRHGAWKRTTRALIIPGGARLEIVSILLPSQRADHRLSPVMHNGTRLETAAILLSRLRVDH